MLPDPIRTSPLTPRYYWDDRTSQYHDQVTKRFVARLDVRKALDIAVKITMSDFRAIASQLQQGQMSLADFQLQGEALIKRIHVLEAAAARGGWAQMTASDWGWVGQRVRVQYDYWRNFMNDIATGKQRLDGRFLRRVDMYANAGRTTFEEMTRRMMRGKGMNYVRRVLGEAEHCHEGERPGCLEEEAKGWFEIDDPAYVPIGNATCLTGCQCTQIFASEIPA